jgi:inosose dehydratase
MDSIKFGCQAYTWKMSYEKYFGKVPHMLDVIAKSEFEGLEIMIDLMGGYYDDQKLSAALEESGVEFAALAVSLPWLNEKETEEEEKISNEAIEFLKKFPGTIMMLGHEPVGDRDNLLVKQKNQASIINGIARRASGDGIKAVFHANSSPNAYFRTEEDYRRLADMLDERVVGLALDAGHMANGNCDVQALFKEFMPKIKHVHYKDMTEKHEWTPMGTGSIDFVALTDILRKGKYQGWIMVEDESPDALIDPDLVTLNNGKYIADHLKG